MFERFTRSARQVVLNAVTEAEAQRADKVTPEHLLLALLHEGTRCAPLLTAAGLTRETVRTEFAAAHRQAGLTKSEAEALTELGIDLSAIVARIEATHGENALAATPPRRPRFPMSHTPFTPQAKSILVNALREAREHNDRHIADEHFLLAMAAAPGLPAQLLATHNLTYPHLRTHLTKAS